tara:strand:- start:2653 stop:3999 length:1347 start_codon:yes stop_codon:yes gene_type:complete
MKKQQKGMWHTERETEKAVYIVRIDDNFKKWFPKKVVDGPDETGILHVESWFIKNNPLPEILEERVDIPKLPTRKRWQKGSLSFSKASQYLLCPKQYYFSYEKKIPTMVSPALYRGSIAHAVLEALFQCDLDKAKPSSYIKALLMDYWDKYKARFETSARKKGKWDDSKRDDILDQIIWVIHNMTDGKMDKDSVRLLGPTETESCIFSEDGILGGIIDAIFVDENNNVKIVDYKTGKAKKNEIDFNHELQGWLYAHLASERFDNMPIAVEFWYTGSQQIKKLELDQESINGWILTLNDTATAIKQQSGSPESLFEARPSENNCKWCDAKPWCGSYHQYIQDTPWQKQGRSKSIKGNVLNVQKPSGNRPGAILIKTQDNEEVVVKGWEGSGKILGSLKEGNDVFCVDVDVRLSDYSGNLEGVVNDPYSIIANGAIIETGEKLPHIARLQ